MAKGRRRARSLQNAVPYTGQGYVIGGNEPASNLHAMMERRQLRCRENQLHPKPEPISGKFKAQFSSTCDYCCGLIEEDVEICNVRFWNNREGWVHAHCSGEARSDVSSHRPSTDGSCAEWGRPVKQRSDEPSDDDWMDDLPFSFAR